MIAAFSKRALNCSACYCVSEQDHKDLVGKVESRAGCRLGGRWKKDADVSVQVVGFENMGVLTACAKARTLTCEFQKPIITGQSGLRPLRSHRPVLRSNQAEFLRTPVRPEGIHCFADMTLDLNT